MAKWQLQVAKAEFSRVVDESIAHGPQIVTRHGIETAVVLSMEDFVRLQGKRPDFKKFLRRESLEGLQIERARDQGRKVLL
jgi:antitoxin Phd